MRSETTMITSQEAFPEHLAQRLRALLALDREAFLAGADGVSIREMRTRAMRDMRNAERTMSPTRIRAVNQRGAGRSGRGDRGHRAASTGAASTMARTRSA